MTREDHLKLLATARQWGGSKADQNIHACGCIGPQNGQPLCPCAMRGVKIIDGRYVRVEDLGPAPSNKDLMHSSTSCLTQEYSEYTRLMGEERKGE